MGKNLIIALLIVVTTVAHSQTTLTVATNAPREGDSLVMKKVLGLQPGHIGDGNIWDFSQCEDIGTHRMKWLTSCDNKDTLDCLERSTRFRYLLQENMLLTTGHENNQTLINYDRPLPMLHFPVVMGDSIGGRFNGWGVYCENMYMGVSGYGNTVADAQGTLILPRGDTLNHVLRLRMERFTQLEIIDSIHSKTGLTEFVASRPIDYSNDYSRTTQSAKTVTEITFCWYAPGWRYPVAILTQQSGLAPLEYMYPPEDQLSQYYDMENFLMRKNQSDRRNYRSGDGFEANLITQCDLYWNDNNNSLSVDYILSSETEVSIIISNTIGAVFLCNSYSNTVSGKNSVTISCSNLPHGQFIVKIAAGDEVYVKKFNNR